MQSKQSNPKYKPKLLIFLLAVLFVIQTITIHYQPPLTTYADSMTDEDGKGSREVVGGPNWNRTGWLFYLIDVESKTQVSTTKAVTTCQAIVDRNGKALPASNIRLVSRYGVACTDTYAVGAPWGPPYYEGAGRGEEVRAYMRADYNGKPYAYTLIESNWGTEMANKWLNQEVYLAFEGFYFHHIMVNGEGTGIWACATAYGWGKIQQAFGIPEEGEPKLKSYTNGVYAYCVKLEDCQEIRDLGFTAPAPGNKTNTEMATVTLGCGMGILWNGDSSIRTYDPSQGSPGKPEPREGKEGLCNIVKGYYKESANGSKESLGVYSEQLVTNNIIVCEEPEFELVSWDVSTTTNTSLDPTNWNPPSTLTRSGTTTESLTLTTPETCVYVLLKQTELEESPEPMDYNYKLTQTQITRRVRFSNPDNQNEMPKIQDHSFLFQNPSHQTECAGHSCDGCEDVECNCSLTDGQTCSTNHGKTCPGTHTCTWGNWKDNTLKISIYNTQKLNYPNILATKDGWNFETLKGNTYKRKVQSTRGIVTASVIKSTNWDYVCILMRGSDKLTLAQWQKKINITLGMKVLHPIIFKKKQVQ